MSRQWQQDETLLMEKVENVQNCDFKLNKISSPKRKFDQSSQHFKNLVNIQTKSIMVVLCKQKMKYLRFSITFDSNFMSFYRVNIMICTINIILMSPKT